MAVARSSLCASGFDDDVTFAYNWPGKVRSAGRILKVTHQGAEPGAKCDFYDCVVTSYVVFFSGYCLFVCHTSGLDNVYRQNFKMGWFGVVVIKVIGKVNVR